MIFIQRKHNVDFWSTVHRSTTVDTGTRDAQASAADEH